MKKRPKTWSAMAKQRGRDGENGVVAYLRAAGFPVERRRLTGVADCGDLAGLAGWTLDCKVRRGLDLSGWIDAAREQAAAATARFGGPHRGGVVVKRRMHSDPGEWFVVLDLATFTSMLKSCGLTADKGLANVLPSHGESP